MQLRFFRVPVVSPEPFAEELNRFLRGHRVLTVQRELVREDAGAYWALCVEYLESVGGAGEGTGGAGGSNKPKVDYKEVLSEADFAVFSRLRLLRKEVAEREGLPVYAVFTNEQMAAMVADKVDSLASLGKIDGVGAARIQKYGALFLASIKQPEVGPDEAGGKPAA